MPDFMINGEQYPPTVRPLSDWAKERARLTVCRNAVDVGEAWELLEMLGLIKPVTA